MTHGAPEPVSVIETQLVRRAQAGDAAAYGELVTMHQAAAFRVALVHLGSAADAEDATQEGFVKAYLALGRFRAGEPFRPWLLRVVGNEARNRRRARGRREGMVERAIAAVRGRPAPAAAPDGPPPPASLTAPSPELAAIAGETRAELRAALAGLDSGERLVVTCRYLLELSEAETAAALGLPAGTVKSRLHRGLRRLRARLESAASPVETAR
ncbi:MAG: RNA polymerase sigma factor [Candidatus Limnocylindrales bacterium]